MRVRGLATPTAALLLALMAVPAIAGSTTVHTYHGTLAAAYVSPLCSQSPPVCPAPTTESLQEGLSYVYLDQVAPANRFSVQAESAPPSGATFRVCAVSGSGVQFHCWPSGSSVTANIPSGTARFRVILEIGADVDYRMVLTRVT